MKNISGFLCAILFTLFFSFSAQAKDVTKFRGVMIDPTVQASDLQYLGQTWNANIIRWQLAWNAPHSSSPTPAEYDAWLLTALNRLDTLLPICEKAGIKVLIDLHSLPGSRDPATSNCRIFTDSASQAQFIAVWNLISRRYAGNKTIWGYDLANEPIQRSQTAGLLKWHELATLIAQNIRTVDTIHSIVVEPDNGAIPEAFSTFLPLPSSIPNVIYSVHMYNPQAFTHQGVYSDFAAVVKYPGPVNGKMWNKAQLVYNLKPVIDFQKKYGVRIYVGEFSAIRWAPAGSAYNYLRDVIDIFESNGWDWTYHAFREYNGWSVEHTEDKLNNQPSTKQTSRERLLRVFFNKNLK
jgi:endoglucanase